MFAKKNVRQRIPQGPLILTSSGPSKSFLAGLDDHSMDVLPSKSIGLASQRYILNYFADDNYKIRYEKRGNSNLDISLNNCISIK